MMRFNHALRAAEYPAPPLRQLAAELVMAIDEVEAEGTEPTNDAAVMVLGAFVAFHTHADVVTLGNYNQLLEQCRASATSRSLQ